jgi:hypothetical protein
MNRYTEIENSPIMGPKNFYDKYFTKYLFDIHISKDYYVFMNQIPQYQFFD